MLETPLRITLASLAALVAPASPGPRAAHVRRRRRLPAPAARGRGARRGRGRPRGGGAGLAGPGRHLDHRRERAAELRLDQPRAGRVGQAAAAHERLRRRGPALARSGGRPVLDLLQAGRPLRPRALADAGAHRLRALERGVADAAPGGLRAREPARQLQRARASTSGWSGRCASSSARRPRRRSAHRSRPD